MKQDPEAVRRSLWEEGRGGGGGVKNCSSEFHLEGELDGILSLNGGFNLP